MEDTYFNTNASNIYTVGMVFILTMLLLVAIKDFRREIQSIYFFYFSAPNKEKGMNFLKIRTILIKDMKDNDISGKTLKKKIEKIF